MSAKKYIRKNIHRWHRVTSLIVAMPILMWSLSGFLHPVMSSFKPDVRNQSLPVAEIDASKIHISLRDASQQNGIQTIHQFRIIKLDSTYYYQIQQLNSDTLTYLSCVDGKLLKGGDQLYASRLAQRYLSEPILKGQSTESHGHAVDAGTESSVHAMHGNTNGLMMMFRTAKIYKEPKLTGARLIKKFDGEYKSSNVLLPVYCVSFDRSDDIRLYVETSTGRLATAIDSKKAWFIRFFAMAHTWSFLDSMGQAKNIILGIVSLLCFVTSLLGFFVYNIMSKKKATSTSKSWHRTLGNVFVVTTALYGLSGAWHAFHKISEKPEKEMIADRSQFSTTDLGFSFADLASNIKTDEKLTNISVIKMNGESYWQLFISKGKEKRKKYIHTQTHKELPNGDIKYGCYLACQFSGEPNHSIMHSKCLNEFTHQYSMMNKRLPVIEVGFKEAGNYYVETATGYLSAITNPYDNAERFSFSNLHMHHYWESWLGDKGKTVQKTVLISTTLGLLLLALTGCWIYWRKKQKSINNRSI
jgi:uncharacterized membrane protein YsdA (DUF1294 family)